MRIAPRNLALSLAPLATLVLFNPAHAQDPMSQIDDFDPGRAILNDDSYFDPFRPTSLEPLAGALKDGRVDKDTPVMVMVRGTQHLALSTMQMSYHHVAQGELAGEPWMVSF